MGEAPVRGLGRSPLEAETAELEVGAEGDRHLPPPAVGVVQGVTKL